MTTKKAKVSKVSAKPKKVVKLVAKVVKPKKSSKMTSFKLSKESAPFSTYKVTEQTVYWSILLAYVLFLSLWILKIQMDTLLIIDRIDSLL